MMILITYTKILEDVLSSIEIHSLKSLLRPKAIRILVRNNIYILFICEKRFFIFNRKQDVPDEWLVEPPREWWLIKHPKWIAKFGKDYAAKYVPVNYR